MTEGLTTLDAMKPGLVLGRYQCLAPIARGGMAAVWAARAKGARGFEKTVALKTMLPILSDDPSFTQMFLEEARIASRIRHPNVAEVLDLGEEGELLYLVMEWIDGEPLSVVLHEALRGGGVPLAVAARIVIDVCAGLHAAHELGDEDGKPLGLVHRDVSPQNILVSMSGQVKIVDFGIAKVTARTSHETAPGQVKGKIAYMSPEQALGKAIDRRSDVFALGTVLYQLVTGKHPFRGDSDVETIQNVCLKAIPPPSAIATRPVDAALEAVVMKALERDPDRRYSTAAELSSALEAALGAERPAPPAELARFLEGLVGGRARARAEALRRAVAEVDGAGSVGPPPEVPLVASDLSIGWQIPRSVRAAATAGGPAVAPPEAGSRRWAPLALGAGLVLLVGVGLGITIGRPTAPGASGDTGVASRAAADGTASTIAEARAVESATVAAPAPSAEATATPAAAATTEPAAPASSPRAVRRPGSRSGPAKGRPGAPTPRGSPPVPDPGF